MHMSHKMGRQYIMDTSIPQRISRFDAHGP